MSVMGWINRKTGRRFWYAVELEMWAKTPTGMADTNRGIIAYSEVGVIEKRFILNYRKIKKVFGKWAETVSKEIKNGAFKIKISCYLGWFKRERIK